MTSITDTEAVARIRVTVPVARRPNTVDPSDVENLLILADTSAPSTFRRIIVLSRTEEAARKRKRDDRKHDNAEDALLGAAPKRFRIANQQLININSPTKARRPRRVCTDKEGKLVVVVVMGDE